MTETELPDITTLIPWYGSARMVAKHVGVELSRCNWVCVPFAGGMSELLHIKARSMVVSDLHRNVINLAKCLALPGTRRSVLATLRRLPFHPDMLAEAQEWCQEHQPVVDNYDTRSAIAYFITQWMGRSGKAGTDSEFSGKLSTRWNGNGGDSNTRYRSALRSMAEWGRMMQRCNFDVRDAFEMIDDVQDVEGNGLYVDPPFPGPGDKYSFAMDETGQGKLMASLMRFTRTRVVCRFYDHPLIRELYPEKFWTWRMIAGGRKQTNATAPEVLLINGPSLADGQ